MAKVKGIMFDFWGTLVRNGIYSPTKQALTILRINLSFPDFIVRFEEVLMKKEYADQKDAFLEVCKEFNVAEKFHAIVIEKLIGLWNKNKFTASPYYDTIKFLKETKEKGIKLILLTNSDSSSVPFVLDKFELSQYFDVIALSCKVGHLKTEPALFEWALNEAGLTKEDVIMVGDSVESDIEGANRAGVKAVLCDRRGKREFEEKIERLDDLNKYL